MIDLCAAPGAGTVGCMTSLFGRLKAALAPAPQIDDADWRRLLRRARLLRRLPSAEQTQLRELCERFLRDKAITGAADFELRGPQALTLAALCCLPVLSLGYDWLRGWDQLIVYPAQFRVRREQHDADSGVVDEWDDDLAGEAWDRGPLVLSWEDVRADLAEPWSGCNVVIHEIAHKLDALDGVMDGTPPLPDAARRRAWIAAFEAGFASLREQLEAGIEPLIDPYAAEAPDEFFAVVSEYHFSAPALLQQALPEVAFELQRFYGARD
jgi:MtfA peptidase